MGFRHVKFSFKFTTKDICNIIINKILAYIYSDRKPKNIKVNEMISKLQFYSQRHYKKKKCSWVKSRTDERTERQNIL